MGQSIAMRPNKAAETHCECCEAVRRAPCNAPFLKYIQKHKLLQDLHNTHTEFPSLMARLQVGVMLLSMQTAHACLISCLICCPCRLPVHALYHAAGTVHMYADGMDPCIVPPVNRLG